MKFLVTHTQEKRNVVDAIYAISNNYESGLITEKNYTMIYPDKTMVGESKLNPDGSVQIDVDAACFVSKEYDRLEDFLYFEGRFLVIESNV
jgi:hypothetical protein